MQFQKKSTFVYTDIVPGIPTPAQVRITWSSLPNQTCGVCATTWIRRRTEMGPFGGDRVPPTEIDFNRSNDLAWEVRIEVAMFAHRNPF